MTDRRTRERLRQEYARLLAIWEPVRAFMQAQHREAGHAADASLPTSDVLMARFDEGIDPPGQMVRAMRATLNELAVGFAGGLARGEATSREFLAAYRVARGRDFFADMGDPSKRLKAILKRGWIADEDEFYSLKVAVEDHGGLRSEDDRDAASALISAFERKAGSRA